MDLVVQRWLYSSHNATRPHLRSVIKLGSNGGSPFNYTHTRLVTFYLTHTVYFLVALHFSHYHKKGKLMPNYDPYRISNMPGQRVRGLIPWNASAIVLALNQQWSRLNTKKIIFRINVITMGLIMAETNKTYPGSQPATYSTKDHHPNR